MSEIGNHSFQRTKFIVNLFSLLEEVRNTAKSLQDRNQKKKKIESGIRYEMTDSYLRGFVCCRMNTIACIYKYYRKLFYLAFRRVKVSTVLPKLFITAIQFLERQSIATHIALLDKKKKI
jgi:hypothetical protein